GDGSPGRLGATGRVHDRATGAPGAAAVGQAGEAGDADPRGGEPARLRRRRTGRGIGMICEEPAPRDDADPTAPLGPVPADGHRDEAHHTGAEAKNIDAGAAATSLDEASISDLVRIGVLSVRTGNSLVLARLRTLGDVRRLGLEEVARLRGVGAG